MKVAYIAAALFAAAASSYAAVVTTADASILEDPQYDWVVLDSSFDTPGPNAVLPSNVTTVELSKREDSIYCYNAGRAVQRVALVSSIDDFCNKYAIGRTLSDGQELWIRYLDNFSGITVLVWMKMINGCAPWTIDSACNNNFRKPVDRCNTRSENNKQGGEMKDNCAHYRIDPGDRNSNDY
ncbi:hypothetical protein D9613_010073 [Agrocybe pediades]|uniref:Uncharacterized protein n=1 Tax=Agrocybe pediades TaxID=84607 RepID=A0A8H4VSM1_9AGAR|nr:hypothetical protein D9613_010073 [Agrocybe pediades]